MGFTPIYQVALATDKSQMVLETASTRVPSGIWNPSFIFEARFIESQASVVVSVLKGEEDESVLNMLFHVGPVR